VKKVAEDICRGRGLHCLHSRNLLSFKVSA